MADEKNYPKYTVRAKKKNENGTKGRNGYDRNVIGQIVYNSLVVYGSNTRAYQDAGICAKTFYEWINKYPDFKELVDSANLVYANTNRIALQAEAIQRLHENLTTGRKTRRTKSNNQGYEEIVITEHGTDISAIEFILSNLKIDTAMQTLISNGYIVIDPNQKDENIEAGLSSETIETIKRDILGIDETEV